MVQSTRGDGTTWKGYLGSTTSWDAAGRRTQGAVKNPSGQTLFEEAIRYTIRDEVRAVIWSHGRTTPAAESQTYSYDELGRLTQFKQGAWDASANSGQGDVNLPTPPEPTNLSTTWRLDELSNWQGLDNDLDGSSAVGPTVHGQSNFYEVFPTRFDTNADGTFETLENLTMSRDDASGFIFKRDERLTGSTATKWLEYKHDLLGRLVEVKRTDTSTTPSTTTVLTQYGYDSAGRLAWRCAGACGSGAPRTWLVYDGTQVVREGTGVSGVAPDGSYVWLGSTLIKATDASGVESYLHQDRLGSVVLQTRLNGASVSTIGQAVYDPYGRPSTTPIWGSAPLTVPYGYAGARRDDAVGLYLMGARWYAPTLGRFIEQDPIGEAGGMNLYAYTSSSPVMWTDPSGLAAERARQQTVEQMANSAMTRTHGNRAKMIATLDRVGAEEWARQVARRQRHIDFLIGQVSVKRESARMHANISAFIKSEQLAELARTRVGAGTGTPYIGAGNGVGLENSSAATTGKARNSTTLETVGVAIGGGTARNGFGHAALIVDGLVYSWGTEYAGDSGDWGASAADYFTKENEKGQSQNTMRSTTIYALAVSMEEKRALVAELGEGRPRNSSLFEGTTRNCASISEQLLENAGILEESRYYVTVAGGMIAGPFDKDESTPEGLAERAKSSGRWIGVLSIGTTESNPASKFMTIWNGVTGSGE